MFCWYHMYKINSIISSNTVEYRNYIYDPKKHFFFLMNCRFHFMGVLSAECKSSASARQFCRFGRKQPSEFQQEPAAAADNENLVEKAAASPSWPCFHKSSQKSTLSTKFWFLDFPHTNHNYPIR